MFNGNFYLCQNAWLMYVHFLFYAAIQDSHQKGQQNDFWEKFAASSADTLWVKNFLEITLSHAVFGFYEEIQGGSQKRRETIFLEKSPVYSGETLWIKNSIGITLSCTVIKMNASLHFMQKFKMEAKNHLKIFLDSVARGLYPYYIAQKFRTNRSIWHLF